MSMPISIYVKRVYNEWNREASQYASTNLFQLTIQQQNGNDSDKVGNRSYQKFMASDIY